jgi:hypothetical protein
VTSDIDVNIEPLPGYRLLEHIGAGGYGEVWRAEAPGGLTKAIKFVFGKQHEKRAANELRALDHVRSVRHPFLLSLERIEVVDGRLMVVTELADGSLKDRFDVCRRDGLPGIPRSELLGYLRDAADALDFMNESHALQHLDIKPENLLLLAGHVKVADFGLVKDVRQSQASLVGGMTPLYAAPEVFRGTPSRQSDQYSLAIVYQEMLTGSLPFCGGNAAELTLQHLNDEPNLAALAVAERYAVSRALSKDPLHRYATCREFVEALFNTTTRQTTFDGALSRENDGSSHAVAHSQVAPRQSMQTDVFELGEAVDWRGGRQPLLVELPAADCTVTDLPAVELKSDEWRPAPALVLGIGGAAGRVLSHYRKLVHEQFNGAAVPAVQLLLLDTDPRALTEAARRGDAAFTPDETLSLPLRRPQHYRENAQQLLTWLSRRWLYNIPRTLRTEGLRPLGRLALADHARQAGQRIRRAMMQAIDPQSLSAAEQAVGRPFRGGAIRVYVVASISGGTGGGMSLDIGYALRALLSKLGVANARVCGLMMHSTGGDPRYCELARVNALSWLTEFKHFQQLENAYPGDTSCGLPAHPPGVPGFDDTYLIHLGDNLNEIDFDQATQSVAEYLRLNTLMPGGDFFEASRSRASSSTDSSPATGKALRSFGLFRRSAAPSEFCDELAGFVSQRVITAWRSQAAQRENPSNAALVRRLQLEANDIAANTRALLELELGSDAATFFSNRIIQPNGADLAGFDVIDQLFEGEPQDPPQHDCAIQGRPTAASVAPLTEKLREELRRWIISQIDDRGLRITGARNQVAWLTEHCGSVQAELRRLRSIAASNLLEFRRDSNDGLPVHKPDASVGSEKQQRMLTYFCMRLDQAAILAAEQLVQLLISDARALADDITALSRELDHIAKAVSRACGDTKSNVTNQTIAGAESNEPGLARNVQARLPQVIDEVDSQLQAEFIAPQGGLLSVVMGGGRPRAQLTAKLYEVSRQIVQRTVAEISNLEQNSDGGVAADLQRGLSSATPSLLEFGGTRRVLAVLPITSFESSASGLEHVLGTPLTAVPSSNHGLLLCVEASELSVQHIAAAFVEYRRDRVEFAGRVHCRADVNWCPLIETSAPAELLDWPVPAPAASPSDALCKTMVL